MHGSYEDRLKQYGLTLLVDRQMRGDLIQTFMIIQQIYDLPINTFFKMAGDRHNQATHNTVTIGPEREVVDDKNFVKEKSKLDIRWNFFSQRVVEHWNVLPCSVKKRSQR